MHADVLTERGDERGELLVLEHRGGEVWAAADAWMTAWSGYLGEDDLDTYQWIRSLAPLAGPPTPAEALPVFTRPISQLLAQLDLEAVSPPAIAPVFAEYRADVLFATLAWIERAFDGVAVPDEAHLTIYQAEAADDYETCDRSNDHVGRWQDLPNHHLLDNQAALAHLDEQGIHYYTPALMTLTLQQMYSRSSWLADSFEFTLMPSKGQLRNYQQRRFGLFDRAQRAATYAFALVAEYRDAAAAWARVWTAERDGERTDWFDIFAPVPR